MIDPVDKTLNLENLKLVSETLPKDVKYFIFWGTLLGVARNKDIIESDDDIDFLCDISFFEDVKKYLSNFFSISIEVKSDKDAFLQLTRVLGSTQTFIDFYFYVNDSSVDYIYDYNSRPGGPYNHENKSEFVCYPKNLIFPIKSLTLKDFSVNIPSEPELLLNYMYGNHWDTPLIKFKDYKWSIKNCVPHISLTESGISKISKNEKK